MKAAIIVFPGSNRERDMVLALEAATGAPPLMVWHGEAELPAVDLIVLPGGCSHGDYLRAGAMAAHSPVIGARKARARAGVLVLGVCNGFQILTETGLLPGALMRNAGLKFICKEVHLRIERTDTPFGRNFAEGQVLRVPVAHHDGNYFADGETLEMLEGEGRVAFRYCTPEGAVGGAPGEAANPNGSLNNIAGIYDAGGTVLGMMPHPENATEEMFGGLGGAPLFAGLAEALG